MRAEEDGSLARPMARDPLAHTVGAMTEPLTPMRRMPRRLLAVPVLALVAAGAGGCATDWRAAAAVPAAATARSAEAPKIPATPVGRQVRWALGQLNGGAARLTEADVRGRFVPRFLTVAMPAPRVVAMLRQTGTQRGPFTFTGFAFPPTATKAIALIRPRSGQRASVRIEVDRRHPSRILRFEVTEAPPRMTVGGRYSGRFTIGGRRVFLRCTGSGSPTVVFSGGLTTDWVHVQARVSRGTRACSYDPANGPWGRSDPAPTSRPVRGVVADLHALLAAAHVPGPYVLVGHSDGGLFAQLYAAVHPGQVRGMVLLDAVHQDYHARRIAMLKELLPPALWRATVRALRKRLPAIVDPEQLDIETSLAQTRAALAASPLRPMPLFVLTHGHPDQPPSYPGAAAADERLWRALQTEIAAMVPDSKHVIAERSGHDIHHAQPQLVIDAIRRVVGAVRDPASWGSR